jgi:hypothetical protein
MAFFKIGHPLFVEGELGWMVGRAICIRHWDTPDLDDLWQHVKNVIDLLDVVSFSPVHQGTEGQAGEKNDSEQ